MGSRMFCINDDDILEQSTNYLPHESDKPASLPLGSAAIIWAPLVGTFNSFVALSTPSTVSLFISLCRRT